MTATNTSIIIATKTSTLCSIHVRMPHSMVTQRMHTERPTLRRTIPPSISSTLRMVMAIRRAMQCMVTAVLCEMLWPAVE